MHGLLPTLIQGVDVLKVHSFTLNAIIAPPGHIYSVNLRRAKPAQTEIRDSREERGDRERRGGAETASGPSRQCIRGSAEIFFLPFI